jgi:methionyl-tRNA formyltransferase
LHDRLAALGADLIVRTLDGLEAGTLAATPQTASLYGPKSECRTLKKDDGKIDWRASATLIDRMVRAMNPWPGASCESITGERILLRDVEPSVSRAVGLANAAPGTAVVDEGRFHVACGSGSIEIITLQRQGKRAMSASEFLRGLRAPIELGFA